MLRIVALNEEIDESDIEEEVQVTKEAQAAIAESEYIRAIKLNAEGNSDAALILFNELLETQVLTEISDEVDNEKLWLMRYNCHKNIALIYEEMVKLNDALEHYLLAMRIDDTDVYTMYRFGILALRCNALELAEIAFNKCLARNPKHWKAADGILQTLCRNNNILAAFGCALRMYRRNPKYKRAIRTLQTIAKYFEDSLPYFEKFFQMSFPQELIVKITIPVDPVDPEDEIFPWSSSSEEIANDETTKENCTFKPPASLKQFRLRSLDWLSVGLYILLIYQHLKETEQNLFFTMNLVDMIYTPGDDGKKTSSSASPKDSNDITNCTDDEKSRNADNAILSDETVGEKSMNEAIVNNGGEANDEPSGTLLATANGNNLSSSTSGQPSSVAISSSSPSATTIISQAMDNASTDLVTSINNGTETATAADDDDTAKPKPRKRCSDLNFLEQWGWHKNRRYSSRKKTQTERVETDTTLNGCLRRMFPKYMEANFDSEWPFVDVLPSPKKEEPNKDSNDATGGSGDTDNTPCTCKNILSMEEFHHETRQHFERFIRKLQAKPFDLMVLIYKWLKYMSYCGNKRVPDALRSMYLNMFNCYLNHFDFSTWNQLTSKNFEASFSICVLFLELNLAHASESQSQTGETWQSVFKHLLFNTGCAYVAFTERYNTLYKLRLINLEYLWSEQRQLLEQSVACLKQIEEILAEDIKEEDDEHPTKKDIVNNSDNDDKIVEVVRVLHLPNLESFCLTLLKVQATRTQLQQQIELRKIPILFETGKWSQLVDIIKQNIKRCSDYRTENETENWIRDFRTQIEILLECLWNMGEYEDCIRWSEKFLHYTIWQYLEQQSKSVNRQKAWAESINYIMSYLEALVLNEGFDILNRLENNLSRLVQNVIRLLVHQLDAPFDKNNNPIHELETMRPWIVLHYVTLREENENPMLMRVKKNANNVTDSEDDDEMIPNIFSLLFTAHEYLGKRQWCSRDNSGLLHYILEVVAPNLRAPLYDSCRDVIYDHMEQVTYCLYGYPQKKARSRHLEDHEATPIELNWGKAMLIFDLYRPECLPEFNSYKLESITADMEQLLLKIIGLFPTQLDQAPENTMIMDFINGNREMLDNELQPQNASQLPFKINSLYYLLGDYYFKNRDFSKTLKYYILDLTFNPDRFDSWAGLALSKASKIETKLNALNPIRLSTVLSECEETLRCFERCITLNGKQTLLWIEYGSFAYTIHSYCSRYLKQPSNEIQPDEKLLAEERRKRMLDTASNCFSIAARLQSHTVEPVEDDGDIHDEKWLCQFMLGKISEKRHEHPKIYLNYYLTAANYLYESNATYPIKINHSSPTTLSVEALEVFYRTNSVIVKYLESHTEISREIGDLFRDVLGTLAKSPFAFNKAKIDGNSLNALKRKTAEKADANSAKPLKIPDAKELTPSITAITEETNKIGRPAELKTPPTTTAIKEDGKLSGKTISPTRRESQESAITVTTTTITSSTTSSTSSSDLSTSDSDTDSDVSGPQGKVKSTIYSVKKLEELYKIVTHNLEECVTRFPEHYKSIYRLVYHFMNGPEKLRAIKQCEELLLGQYRTTLGNQINGLFYDRKTNNLFNGIWRIPSSEIDRPGSFPAHLVKCVRILIDMLMKTSNHRVLIDVGLQLYKTPDADKRYITDNERTELYQQSILFTVQILRGILHKNMQHRNDMELLDLMLDIYKIHKKCVKYMNQKEPLFTQLIVEVYKLYISDKVDCILENLNYLDLAIKLCLQEISVRKNMEKLQIQSIVCGSVTTIGSISGTTTTSGSDSLGDVLSGFNTMQQNATGIIPANATVGASQQAQPRIVHIPGLPPRMRQRFYNTGAFNKPLLVPMIPTMDMLRPSIGIQSGLTTTTTPVASAPILSDVLQSPNIMSMISSLNASAIVQSDTVGFQKLVAEYYKQIMERANLPVTTIPNVLTMNTIATSSSSSLAATNVTTTFPLVNSLPIETTITPAPPSLPPASIASHSVPISDLIGNQTTISNKPILTQLPTYDLTITPAIISKTLSSTAGGSSSTTTTMPSSSVGGINTLQYPTKLTDLPASLTITSLTKAQLATGIGGGGGSPPVANIDIGSDVAISSTNISSGGRNPSKPKSSGKSARQTQPKPYNRNMITTLDNNSSSIYANKQQQLMAAYTDLLKSTVITRGTPPNTNASIINVGDGSVTASTVRPKTLDSPLNSNNTTFTAFPTFTSNSITMTALPKRGSPTPTVISCSVATGTIPSQPAVISSAISASTISATFPIQVTATATSPTKTLQQKLVERQKAANQINDLVATNSSGRVDSKPPAVSCDADVIVLD